MTKETKEKPIRDVKLQYGGLNTADHSQTRWGVKILPDHTMDDVRTAACWSIQASRITKGDIIDVRTEDDRFYAELYVTGVKTTGVEVQVMRHMELAGHVDGPIETPDFVYAWKGPSWGHCVIRKADSMVMIKNLKTKAEALLWIKEQMQAAA